MRIDRYWLRSCEARPVYSAQHVCHLHSACTLRLSGTENKLHSTRRDMSQNVTAQFNPQEDNRRN